ncbi:hypothetical protein TH72_15415 [Salmonella enterica]|nr:hypothetical protein [Salmonella enterica]
MKKLKRLSRFVATAPRPRLWGWLLAAAVMFLVIAVVSPQQLPVVIYKLSLISLAAVLGYTDIYKMAVVGSDAGYIMTNLKGA